MPRIRDEPVGGILDLAAIPALPGITDAGDARRAPAEMRAPRFAFRRSCWPNSD
jgi:hypothetical protein